MYRKTWLGSLLALLFMVSISNPAIAAVGESHYSDFTAGQLELSGFFASSEIEYEGDSDNDKFDLEKNYFGVTVATGVTEKLNVYGTFGYIFDGKISDDGQDFDLDNGYYLAAGARYKVFQSGKVAGYVYGQFDYTLEETYADEINNIDIDGETSGYELFIGGIVKYQMMDQMDLYGGLSFVAISDLTMDYTFEFQGRTFNDENDFERSDKLGIKLGAQYKIDSKRVLAAEANLGNEQVFVISFGNKF